VVRTGQPEEPGGPGKVAGGGEEAAGVLLEEVLEDPPYCLRCLGEIYIYIIRGIRGPRMPRRRVSWLSTVPWMGVRRGGRPGTWDGGSFGLRLCAG